MPETNYGQKLALRKAYSSVNLPIGNNKLAECVLEIALSDTTGVPVVDLMTRRI